jgi:release factor glutamine methyltransferase
MGKKIHAIIDLIGCNRFFEKFFPPDINNYKSKREIMTTRKIISYKDKMFIINEGVYEPDRYSFFLEENIVINNEEKVLDIVTGSGFFSIMAAENASKIVGIDINPKSIRCAKLNALLNEYEDKTDFRVGSLYSALAKEEKFDVILANPPEFPTPKEKSRNDSFGISNLAGPDGRLILDQVISGAKDHLNNNGRLILWNAWYSNIPKTIELLVSLGFEVKIIAEKYFSVGLLTFERSDYLAKIGLPLIEKNGELVQYHVIISAKLKLTGAKG